MSANGRDRNGRPFFAPGRCGASAGWPRCCRRRVLDVQQFSGSEGAGLIWFPAVTRMAGSRATLFATHAGTVFSEPCFRSGPRADEPSLRSRLEQLSTAAKNYLTTPFVATRLEEEARCQESS